ncbi:MAG: arylsulfatase, partial [Planctomycetota bacterium]
TLQRGHVIDMMATCMELAGAKYPAERNGRKVDPHESLSLVPVLTGGQQSRDHAYIFNHAGTHAVIKGDYKIVREGRKRPWYLYNLAKNRTETINLAEKEPSLVAALEEIWENRWGRKKK